MIKNEEDFSKSKELFWQLSKPLMVLSLFQASYSFIDVFWISKMNPESFFAISVVLPLFSLITSFGASLGVGTNSIIAREIGEGAQKEAYNSILHGVVACFILGVIIMLSTLFIKNILILMNATSEMDLSTQYLTPILLCSHVFLFSNLFQSTMQAEGNSKTPTILLILTNILNLILDPIFIFIFNWGVSGAAYATILSSAIATIYLLYCYLSGKTQIALNFKYFKQGIVYDIFLVAIPNFLINCLSCGILLFYNKILIQQLGQIGVLLYSTATGIQNLIISPQNAFRISLITVSGQLFGANKFDEINEIYHYVLKYSFSIAVISTIAFFFIRDYGFALFSVTGVETSVFYIALAGIIINPFLSMLSMTMKMLDGMGKTYHSLFLMICMFVFNVLLTLILAPIFPSGGCVLIDIVIGDIVFAIIFYILFEDIIRKKGKEGFHVHFKKLSD